ncbi:hypothetical protein [Lacisediminihabitans changchengi]|uniref:Uncharacterized protein n=1 Tax=Lacisediminihabitans changchengi TaxID=2787634 RepID=A0A934SQ71_9MICO|nr:hypothetical protein [Lacisediminihabitans changchengi]MBK4346955.1 hypothetical protein [Lacisediminihabitans changchengi]MBK4347922.1 hypothetical protein [Lacisediminihabitans changchengi]
MARDESEISAIAEDLYSLMPRDFIARRNERAKALEKPLAAAVRALTKPTPAAWLVNQVSRHHREELDIAIALGTDLQHAQGNADRVSIQRLSKQHREVVRKLAARARELGAEAAVSTSAPVLDEVAQTFSAAMSDAAAAAAVRSGILIRSLQSTGLEPVDLEGSLALPDLVGAIAVRSAPSATWASATADRRAAAERQRVAEESLDQRQKSGREQSREQKRKQTQAQSREQTRERERERALAELQRRLARVQESVERASRQLTEIDDAREQKTAQLDAARDELAHLHRQIDAL